MLSDSAEFRFANLDPDKKLHVYLGLREYQSKRQRRGSMRTMISALRKLSLEWRSHRSQILAYIDTILLDAINSSPHTTPTKAGNTILRSYPKYLRGTLVSEQGISYKRHCWPRRMSISG